LTDPHRVARLLVLTASNRLIHGADGPDGWRNTGQGGTTFGGEEFATSIEDVARNLDEIGGDMPEDVARWLIAQGWDAKTAGAGRYNGPGSRLTPHPADPYNSGAFSLPGLGERLDSIGEQRMTQDRARYDLLVELCAGTAALSWASAGLKFPVSRMGSKAGYSHAILSSVGLREGDPLPRYLWNEPDAELARTLALLAAPGGAQAVAEVIRSWIPCPNGHEADGGAWCLECATWTNGEPNAERDDRSTAPAPALDSSQPDRASAGRSDLDPDRPATVRGLASRCDAADRPKRGARLERKRDGTIRRWASGPSTGKQDARRLWERLRKERPEASPEREGAWCYYNGNGYRGGNGDSGFVDAEAGDRFGGFKRREGSALLDTLAPLPATVVCGRAEDVPTPPDCSRVLVYIDPPYLNTTGYAHEFDRAAVVAVARRWAEAGAHVVISEAEPIPELVADGWTFADIADARIGQRRTFSRQQREVLTSNRPLVPRHAWPSRGSDPRQGGLFGGGS
jgi:hypothetical protein